MMPAKMQQLALMMDYFTNSEQKAVDGVDELTLYIIFNAKTVEWLLRRHCKYFQGHSQ